MFLKNSIGIIYLMLLVPLPTGCDLVLNIKATPPVGTMGSSVLFEVLNPPLEGLDSVSWFFNNINMIRFNPGNTVINPVYSRRIQYDNASGSLELQNLTLSDQGLYKITMMPEFVEFSSSLNFNVYEKILGGAITGPTEPLIAGKSSVNLSCQAASGTIITRVWLKDGQPLSPSNRMIFSTDNSTVTISHVEKGDAGQYQCKLINPVSTDTAEYSLIVNYGPESVTVMGKNTAEINEEVEFKCSALSVPSVSNFNWIFNGTRTDVKMAQYIIKQASYSDSGSYTCEASNEVTGLQAISAVHHLVVQDNLLSHGLSGGAIAGIVISVLVVLGLIAAGLVFAVKKKRPSSSNPNATNAKNNKTYGGESELTYADIHLSTSSSRQVQNRSQPPPMQPKSNSRHVQKGSQPPAFVQDSQYSEARGRGPQDNEVIYSQVKPS